MEGVPDASLIERAREVVRRHLAPTPLVKSEWLSAATGRKVFLKCEGLQVTGSFKVRGALVAVAEAVRGGARPRIAASSAGNHGLGLAYAGRLYGVAVTVVVPSVTPRVKIDGMEALGANVRRSPYRGYDDTEAWTLEHLGELGDLFISPYDDPAVIAGNGVTLASEIFRQCPDPDWIAVPAGGGGCAVGCGISAREESPKTRIVAVNSEASPALWVARRTGRRHEHLPSSPTIAEGIEGGVSERAFQLAQAYVDEVVLASEEGIRRALAGILHREHLLVEGAGAAGVAAALENALPPGARVVIVLTGSNIDRARLREILETTG